MADSTFELLWKRILLYAPRCPLPLAQEFVNTAYSRALEGRQWSGLRVDTEVNIPAAYTTGMAGLVNASAAVSGSGTTWTSAMVGRQFLVGSRAPVYTIATVPTATSLTLDRVYGGNTVISTAYEITLMHLSMPTDFSSLESVRDTDNNWKLHTQFHQLQLDKWDAQRSTTGTSWVLAAAPRSSADVVRYELWPRTTGGKVLTIRYFKKPSLLSANADAPIFPIRGDVLRHGAMVELALWPGVGTEKNPFYDLDQHRLHEERFQEGLSMAGIEDQNISQTSIQYDDWVGLPYAPLDAKFLQSHDVGIS